MITSSFHNIGCRIVAWNCIIGVLPLYPLWLPGNYIISHTGALNVITILLSYVWFLLQYIFNRGSNVGVDYRFTRPFKVGDAKIQYQWKTESWSACSVTCGRGKTNCSISCVYLHLSGVKVYVRSLTIYIGFWIEWQRIALTLMKLKVLWLWLDWFDRRHLLWWALIVLSRSTNDRIGVKLIYRLY